MAAVSQYFVDPSAGSDITGDGSLGNPWQSVQHALDTITRNSTNGDQINIKAGADDVLSADLDHTTYGNPAYNAPLIFRGYTSAADDGGIGVIDFNGANSFTAAANVSGICWIDLELHGSTDSIAIATGKWAVVANCYLHDMGGTALSIRENFLVLNSRFEDIDTYGVETEGADGEHGIIDGCFFANGTKDMTACIYCDNYSVQVCNNIISIDGATNGISAKFFAQICNNSIFSSGGTGAGIICNTTGEGLRIWNNLIEGFSGSGGVGVEYRADTMMSLNNSAYNNATNFSADAVHIAGGNESLGATPFAKSGSNTFANRFTYFEPADVGSVRLGAYGNSTRDRGAVQHSSGGGGGSGNKVGRLVMGVM